MFDAVAVFAAIGVTFDAVTMMLYTPLVPSKF
jgi:hypothetical protein